MIATNSAPLKSRQFRNDSKKERYLSQGSEPEILTDIYKEDINIVTWQRNLLESLKKEVKKFVSSNPRFEATMTVSPKTVFNRLEEAFGTGEHTQFLKDITDLVQMFCYLFDLSNVGLRLGVLDSAMCPKFHVDRIPCRLVTTYYGIGTEWLPHQAVDRTKLGAGSNGLPDNKSGLYPTENDITENQYEYKQENQYDATRKY